ncbi:hypothetical protein PPYR_06243 [Photinus pyralis]|uniref:Uncharacterized protein n=2 Tax=Photinus pyralis TaxID=7054 RepID=A0A5N4ATC1_PHOPY|nr:nuclear transcription factor Y subunit beta-like [Photinus pyralis]KAB0800503.1 hypothetical protein PPYR_06243 [Photinus pyralis]
MRWIRLFAYLMVTHVSWILAETQDDIFVNKAASTGKDLRQALLEALSDLETSDDFGNTLSGTDASGEVQKVYNPTPSTITRTEKSVSIETSSGVQYKPIIQHETNTGTRRPILVKVRNATTARPTTTTPVITTSTEENEAKVESLQFFSAPLVAAFTVHQDALGVPKSVEPILKDESLTTITEKELEEKRLKELEEIQRKEAEEKRKEDEVKLQQYLRSLEQIRVQQELEVKQKSLQEQIKALQKQKQQHEEYLLKQRQLIQEQERRKAFLSSVTQQEEYDRRHQQHLEQQRQALLTQTNPSVNYNKQPDDYYLRQQNLVQEQERQRFLSYNRFEKPTITVQPAVTFQPASYVDNSLQLPTKNHQNFQDTSFNRYQQLPTQGPRDFHVPFTYTPSVESTKSFGQNPPRGNRVFRQETGTGNFVNSDSSIRHYTNTFNQQSPQQNRFFRSNQNSYSITPSVFQDYHSSRYVRAPYVNHQLNNLLYYSGIGRGKQQEDLNLISKVLAYNIRGDNYYPGSDIYEQRLL